MFILYVVVPLVLVALESIAKAIRFVLSPVVGLLWWLIVKAAEGIVTLDLQRKERQ